MRSRIYSVCGFGPGSFRGFCAQETCAHSYASIVVADRSLREAMREDPRPRTASALGIAEALDESNDSGAEENRNGDVSKTD